MEYTSTIEKKIEYVRHQMYEAYESSRDYEEILALSQLLDRLLNRLPADEVN